MTFIFCSISMFSLHQNIMLMTESDNEVTCKSVAYSTLENLGADIAAMCEKHRTYNVRLQGSNEYANGLVEDIYTIAKTNYGLNNINIEVI